MKTPSGSNPGSTRCSRAKLVSSKPAAISSTSDSETSATSRPARRRPPDPIDPRPASFSASCTFTPAACNAGSRPIASPVTSVTTSAKPSASGSILISSARGIKSAAEGDQRGKRPLRQQQARDAAKHGEEHAFGDELAHHVEPRRAEREARRDLPSPAGKAREQQVGDVRARNQQHAAHGAEQQQITLSLLPDRIVQERHDLDVATARRRWRGSPRGSWRR